MSGATPTILYVGNSQDLDRSPWAQCFDRAPLRLERVDDVYLALARLGRARLDPAAVIVCVDSLDPSEFEFFGLASRHCRRAVVYACGCGDATDKLEAALGAGARAVLTPERFEKMSSELAEAQPELDTKVSPSVPTDDESPSADRPIEPVRSPDTRVEVASAPPAEAPATEAHQGPPRVSVPWRRTTGRPVRTPPGRRQTSPPPRPEPPDPANRAMEDAERGEDHQVDVFDGPLLSPEELDLLMRDDLPARPAEAGGNKGDGD